MRAAVRSIRGTCTRPAVCSPCVTCFHRRHWVMCPCCCIEDTRYSNMVGSSSSIFTRRCILEWLMRRCRVPGEVHCRPYARLADGPVERVWVVVGHRGHLTRGVVATGKRFLVDRDERRGRCVLGLMGGRGEHGRGSIPRGRSVPTRLVENSHQHEGDVRPLPPPTANL